MRHVISWSGGKDSTATCILAARKGIPITDIIFIEVMYDRIRGISGEDPDFIRWVHETGIPGVETLFGGGVKVNVLHSDRDFLDCFFNRIKSPKSKRQGRMYGYPISGRCIINSECKRRASKEFFKGLAGNGYVNYIGIAADETERLGRMRRFHPEVRSLLAEEGVTEAMAMETCREAGLLAPLYETRSRQGCWFCPNRKLAEWSLFRKRNPGLYAEWEGLHNSLCVTEKVSFNDTVSSLRERLDAYDARMAAIERQPGLGL